MITSQISTINQAYTYASEFTLVSDLILNKILENKNDYYCDRDDSIEAWRG